MSPAESSGPESHPSPVWAFGPDSFALDSASLPVRARPFSLEAHLPNRLDQDG